MTLRPPRGGLLLWKVAIFPPKLPPPRSFSGGRKNQLHCSQSHTLLPPQHSARFINSGLFFTSSLPFSPSVTLSHFGVGGGGDGGNKPRGYFLRLHTISSASLTREHYVLLQLLSLFRLVYLPDRHPITIPQISQREELFLPFCMLHQISSP